MKLIKNGEIDIVKRGMSNVKSFCIGLEGSPDLEMAKKVADFLGTEHYSFTYTVEEGIDCIPEVIYYTETYNNTTIRASTPMYLLARKIKSLGVKYVLTGEGADEIFGGIYNELLFNLFIKDICISIKLQIKKNFIKKLLEKLKIYINMIY
jgi:asparagine synthase (glutamine-hydrolysing)